MIVDNLKCVKSAVSSSIKGSSNMIKRSLRTSSNSTPLNRRQHRLPSNNNSRIREIIYYICENREEFEDYKFLILLSDDYFNKKMKLFPSKKYYINKLNIPGKLKIEKYSELKYNINKYTFESNPLQNQLYIKLQKEQVYVPYSDYEYKLLESKFNEFYDILGVIGAKYIKISKMIQMDKFNEINMGTEIGLNTVCKNAKVSNKVSVMNEKNTVQFLSQEMTFNNEKDPELNKLIDNNYFYLPNQMDLHNLIIRRIENNQTQDKYTYIHSDSNIINKKILTKLKKLNIGLNVNFDRTFKQISNFNIDYEIQFYNIKNKNINSNFAIQEDETPWFIKTVQDFLKSFN